MVVMLTSLEGRAVVWTVVVSGDGDGDADGSLEVVIGGEERVPL